MKMFAFIYSFPPFQGGSGMGMYDLLSRLASEYSIDVLTFNHGGAKDIEKLNGMMVYRLSRWQVASIYPIPKPTLKNIRIFMAAYKKQHDIVYTRTRFFFTTFIGLIVSYLKGIPMVHTEPGSCYLETGNKCIDCIAWIWDNTIGRMVANRARCIGVSYESAKMMVRLGAEDIEVITNGVNQVVFKPPVVTKKNIKPCVLYVGRLKWTKGADILNDVAEMLDGTVSFMAAGSGEYPMNKKIKLLGQLSPVKLAECMQSADILVLPSRMEGLPRVVQEAMCCRLPVVATDVGGTRELIEHGKTGYLTKVDAKDICDKITVLVNDRILRDRMGLYAYWESRKYLWNSTVNKYKGVFYESIHSRY